MVYRMLLNSFENIQNFTLDILAIGGKELSRYRVEPQSKWLEFGVKRSGTEWVALALLHSHDEALSILRAIGEERPRQRPTPRTFSRWHSEYRAKWERSVMDQPGAAEALDGLMSNFARLLTPPNGQPPTNEQVLRAMDAIDNEKTLETGTTYKRS